jgi:hypothetical protein
VQGQIAQRYYVVAFYQKEGANPCLKATKQPKKYLEIK